MSHNVESWIADASLAGEGKKLIDVAREDMPALTSLVEKYKDEQPLRNSRIAVCVIPTAETGNLAWALKELGASVRLCSDNVVSVDDRVAAAMVDMGVSVFGKRNQTREQFYECIRKTVQFPGDEGKTLPPTQIIDDGADMTLLIHKENHNSTDTVLAVSEQTTCGVIFDTALAKKGELKVPVIDINTGLKAAFDNRYGPRESFIPSFRMCKEMQLGGRVALVAGYGMVGKGVAEALQMAGSRVLVSESNPVRATEALMSGLEVTKVDEAIAEADIFVTATSTPNIFTTEQITKMKTGATICNMGENLEYDAHLLPDEKGYERTEINPNLVRYSKGEHYIDSLCDGYLLNMRVGGNSPRVLGITFALHLIAQIKVAQGWRPERGKVHRLPPEVENEVALLNFPDLKGKLTTLTDKQKEYIGED